MKRKGIALKTFIFTSILISSVIVISFAILYLVLPDYYLYTKTATMQDNSYALTQNLSFTKSEEEAKTLISDFITINNAEIMTFDNDGFLIPILSSPLVSLEDYKDTNLKISINGDIYTGDDLNLNPETDNKSTIIMAENQKQTEAIEDGQQKQLSEIVSVSEPSEKGIASNQKGIVQASQYFFATKDVAVTEDDALKEDYEIAAMPQTAEIFYITITEGENKVLIKNDESVSNSYSIDNGLIDKITISSTFQPIDEAKNVMLSLLTYMLLIDIIIVLIASYIYAKKFTKPILQLSDCANQMHNMGEDALSNIRSNDEIGQLSQNLDSLYINLCTNINNLKLEMNKVNQLEQSKTEFMRAAGHELKTPISALKGILEGMIDNVGVYKNKDKYINESKDLVDKLSVMVNEILNASKIDNVDESLKMESVYIGNVLKEILINFEYFIEEKNITLNHEDIDCRIISNEEVLKYCISNLISNAVKYTPKNGLIAICFEKSDEYDTLSIENTCDEVSDEQIKRIFEPFYTFDYSRNKNKSGTGLGLYIVKRNLERLEIPFNVQKTQNGLKFSIYFENDYIDRSE